MFTVLEEKFVFEMGMVYLHVMQVHQPIDLADVVVAKVPTHCQDFVLDNVYEEGKSIVRYHVEIFYPYRGQVRLRAESGFAPGILWRRTDRSRMRALIQDAAELYWGNYDSSPERVLVRKLPAQAPSALELSGILQGKNVGLYQEAWVPQACVIVAGGHYGSK